MQQDFVLITKQVVERLSDFGRNIALLGLQFRLDLFHSLRSNLCAQCALAWTRERLVEHEHVLRLVQVPGLGEWRSPAAIHELGVAQRPRTADPYLGGCDAAHSHPD